MEKANYVNVIWATGLLLIGGCSAHAPSPKPEALPKAEAVEQEVDESDDSSMEADEEEPATDEAPPSGPATLSVMVSVNGKSQPGVIKVTDDGGHEVVSGKSGEPMTIESGNYMLVVSIEDAAILADRPTQSVPLTIPPGANLKQPFEFAWASEELNVRVNGKLEKNAKVRLYRDGELAATIDSASGHVPLSPGRYEAEVLTHGATIKVNELFVPEGATQSESIDVTM